MAIRGTSAAQDGRYQAQEKKLLAQMSFPKCFEQRVDMRKVQREVVNQWVTERLTQLLGFEDDIVVALAINLLEPKVDEKLDPRQLQVALTGFLEKQAAAFTEELWQLLLSAQSNPTGIPSAILDQKKRELQRVASEKDELKKVLEAKRAAVGGLKTDDQRGRPRSDEKREDAAAAAGVKTERRSPQRGDRREETRRRSRSLQRRPRSPPRRFRSPRRRSPSVRRRSRSPRRRRRSPSPRRRSRSSRRRSPSPRKRSRSPRRRSRSSPRGHSRRDRSRSPSVKRRRSRRSPSRSPESSRDRRPERRGRRESSGRHSRRSPSSSSSASSGRSSSSSRSPSPRRRSTKSR